MNDERLANADLLVKAIMHNDLALAWRLAKEYKDKYEVQL